MLLTSSGAPEKNEKINGRVETAIKLLYHCILASEKISNDELKKEKENKTSFDGEIVLHTAVICMAGYQVLGILLDMLLPGKLSSFLRENQQNIVDLYPSPQLERWVAILPTSFSGYMNLPLNRIVKIATQSSLCMSKIFWKACICLSTDLEANDGNQMSICWENLNLMQFGDHFRELLTASFPYSDRHSTKQCRDVCSFIEIYREIITSTVASWNVLLNMEPSDFHKNERIDNPIQVIVQAYKSLTECASEIESIFDQKEIMKQSLHLRRDATLVLLLQYRCRIRGWTKLPDTFIVKHMQCSAWSHIWIKACNLAKKASIHYASYSSKIEDYGELFNFHEIIGDALDESIQYVEKQELCYIEYCAYRAIHCVESMKANGIHNMATNHPDAIFCQLPFPYMGKSEGLAFFLASFYAAVAAVHHVPLQNIVNLENLEDLTETITNKFLKEFLEMENIIDANFLKIGYRLFSNLPLFQIAFDFMNDPPSTVDFLEFKRIVTIGIILGEIVAPFNVMMSSRENDKKYLEKACDAYMRAAGLFNILEDVSYSTNGTNLSKRSFIEKSDNYMSKCYSILSKSPNSVITSRFEVTGKVRISMIFMSIKMFSI
jgi:hypothetical protein